MADKEMEKQEKPFYVERAKSGRASCKKCKQKINVEDLRIGKLGFNPFTQGTMKYWHHVPCMFEVFKKQRKSTKKIESFAEIEGWEKISEIDKDTIKSFLSVEELKNLDMNLNLGEITQNICNDVAVACNKDNTFRAFRKLCSELTNERSYLAKTNIVRKFFEKGSDGKKFVGDLLLWCRSLLPMAGKRIYNLQNKQLVKIFSDIFQTDHEEMIRDLEQGDIAETIGTFFEKSLKVFPTQKAVLTLLEVDHFLEQLSKLTREIDQTDHFKKILPKCSTNDLKTIIRLIKHDLRINAGPKHILEALDPNAYPAFQASRDLAAVLLDVRRSKGNLGASITVSVRLMTPVLPMLAEACSSVEMAFKKCPNGMFSEIKYDGERVQLHKQGNAFKYFSRNLKPVLDHKVSHFEEYIPQAFPHGRDMILDSEILMVDTNTGQPLHFGTLGIRKKAQFKDATVCLFVFDCIYYNGESLIDKAIVERRKILQENMTEVTHHVMFSEIKEIHKPEDLEAMMEEVFKLGLEGLVLKPMHSKYEPGKRHWLKVKKDYLAGGTMADSADLVVLGAWFGTGKKGGIMSIFLMGCWDYKRCRWATVTKVHCGNDDETLERLQEELEVEKIARDPARKPPWLHCDKTMLPDFVVRDPTRSQVWEITGAEFTCNQVHTADGISIRFPRVTRIRTDKNYKTATTLSELKNLYAKSKDTSGFSLKKETDHVTHSSYEQKKIKLKTKVTPSKFPEVANDNNEEYPQRTMKHSSSSSSVKLKNQTDHVCQFFDYPKQPKLKSSVTPEKLTKVANEGTYEESQQKIAFSSSLLTSLPPKKRKVNSSNLEKRTQTTENSKLKKDENRIKVNEFLKQAHLSKKNCSRDSAIEIPLKKRRAMRVSSEEELVRKGERSKSGSETDDDDDPIPNNNEPISMKNKLPDLFKGKVVYLHKEVHDYTILKRFIIAYGGKLYNENRKLCLENGEGRVTHVVYPTRRATKLKEFKVATNVSHVSADWLWDTIINRSYNNEARFELELGSDC